MIDHVLRFAGLVAFALAGCGESESRDDPVRRTCDYRPSEQHEPTCTEWGPGRSTDGLMSACDEIGGVWSNDPCPVEDRLGCCTFVSNGDVRECSYPGVTGDPETLCTDVYDGVWTPG